MHLNSPNSVGIGASANRRTSFSCLRRYRMRSAIVMNSRPCLSANFSSSGARAMSIFFSSTISHSTPAGYRPARRAKSTVASVWPARLSTPPSRASSGRMWPGRARSSGRVAGSTSADRGRSIERGDSGRRAVDVVDRDQEGGALALGVLRHHRVQLELTRPLARDRRADVAEVWCRKNAIFSGVTNSAAMMRSPSFSRSSSSTTTTISPARWRRRRLRSWRTASVGSLPCEESLDVLGGHVDFEIHQ